MRSYRNKQGDTVSVSDGHLETAVKIKLELQKASPSGRCSWKLHRELMLKEGFEDSENSEQYRQMIKQYQMSIGELPSSATQTDERVSKKLESLKEHVGEIAWEKRENQGVLRQLNKLKRELIDGGIFIEETTAAIEKVLGSMDFKKILKGHTFSPVKDHSDNRMIALISDWHIGADVDVEGNKYNFEIAKQRILDYTFKLLNLAHQKKVYRIDVIYCGDMVEGGYMRSSQAYGIEFPVSEQMARGGQLLIEMLLMISKHHFCTYSGFAGNHDRMNQSDKNGSIDGDTAMVVVNKIVKTFIEASKIENLMFVDTHPYHAKMLNVNGINIKAVHGDNERKADHGKIHDHSSRDGINYHIICYGHFHHHMLLEVGINKFEVRIGSLKGSDDYSERLGVGSEPSQAAIIIDHLGDIDVFRIGLAERTWLDALGIK